ncbi:hypothetical protein [Spirosoma flavum]|uniref:Uncharacterized protein n=1 Tax=Spirosoma flavum TaxID=2048557 RepID=A0ABW6ADZ3_9BACT
MISNKEESQLAHALSHDINDALNHRIEERFRAALFLVDPGLDMATVTIVSNVENDNELTIDGIDDETIDKAMVIFEAQQE